MTNEEFYKDELKEIIIRNIGIDATTGNPKICAELFCLNCVFKDQDACSPKKIEQWLQSEHVEQVDWSKVKVDTPIYVRDCETDSNGNEKTWVPRHFAKFENGTVYVWDDGGTSFTVKSEDSCSSWNYAKLAESED